MEIDIELAPGDQTSLPKTKEQAERDSGNQLHMLTNRHDKFLDSLREVKVRHHPNICRPHGTLRQRKIKQSFYVKDTALSFILKDVCWNEQFHTRKPFVVVYLLCISFLVPFIYTWLLSHEHLY